MDGVGFTHNFGLDVLVLSKGILMNSSHLDPDTATQTDLKIIHGNWKKEDAGKIQMEVLLVSQSTSEG